MRVREMLAQLLELAERNVAANERSAAALEQLAGGGPRKARPKPPPAADPEPTDVDRAAARATARRLGMHVRDRGR